ncbi:MAG: YfiR family protein [Ginsengibacter sp.]
MCKRLKSCAIVFLAGIFLNALAYAQAPVKEPFLKAAFIYNFTKYIDWNVNNTDDFTICIFGNSSIYEPLTEIAATKTVQNKKIIIRRVSKPDEITSCNVLFISADNTYPLSSILATTGRGTLIVSETPGYANMGTAINFVIVNDKLKFEANVKSINDEGLKASSQLLKLAIIVN